MSGQKQGWADQCRPYAALNNPETAFRREGDALPLCGNTKNKGIVCHEATLSKSSLAMLYWKIVISPFNYLEEEEFRETLKKLNTMVDDHLYEDIRKIYDGQEELAKKIAGLKGILSKKLVKQGKQVRAAVAANALCIPLEKYVKAIQTELRIPNDTYSSEKQTLFDLTIDSMRIYQKLYAMILMAETDIGCRKTIRGMIRSEYGPLADYIDGIAGRLTDGNYIDAAMLPLYATFIEVTRFGTIPPKWIEAFSAAYLYIQCGGNPLYGDEADFFMDLYFNMFAVPFSDMGKLDRTLVGKLETIAKTALGTDPAQKQRQGHMPDTLHRLFHMAVNDVDPISNDVYRKRLIDCLYQADRLKKQEKDRLLSGYFYHKEIYAACAGVNMGKEQLIALVKDGFRSIQEDWREETSDPKGKADPSKKTDKRAAVAVLRQKEDRCILLDILLFADEWMRRQKNSRAVGNAFVRESQKAQDQEKSREINLKKKDQQIAELKKELMAVKRCEDNRKDLENEVVALQKKIRKLNAELEESRFDRKELIGLRNYLYEEQEGFDPPEKTGVILEDACSYLNSIKGILIGGHQNFTTKLSKLLPSWKKYSVGQSIPQNCLLDADLVVFFTDHIDHSTYLKAINTIRRGGCKIAYLHNVNIEYAVNHIYNIAKE